MEELKKKIEKLLLKVQRPSRYIGGEVGSVVKDKDKVDVRFAFCFPRCGSMVECDLAKVETRVRFSSLAP